MTRTIPLLVAALFSAIAWAGEESQVTSNGYILHFNALMTDFLTPEVATQYGLTRSKHRGMLNISVIREIPGATGEAVPAKVNVTAADLMQKTKDIELREIREGEAIYYISEFPVTDREIVNFTIQAKPEGSTHSIRARFSHEFFVN